jgi:hypothetical protein
MCVILLISIVLGTSLVVHNILHKVNGPCLAQIKLIVGFHNLPLSHITIEFFFKAKFHNLTRKYQLHRYVVVMCHI